LISRGGGGGGAAEILLNALLVVVIVVIIVFFFFVRWFVRVESVLTILKRIGILCGNCINFIWNWKQNPTQKSAFLKNYNTRTTVTTYFKKNYFGL